MPRWLQVQTPRKPTSSNHYVNGAPSRFAVNQDLQCEHWIVPGELRLQLSKCLSPPVRSTDVRGEVVKFSHCSDLGPGIEFELAGRSLKLRLQLPSIGAKYDSPDDQVDDVANATQAPSLHVNRVPLR